VAASDLGVYDSFLLRIEERVVSVFTCVFLSTPYHCHTPQMKFTKQLLATETVVWEHYENVITVIEKLRLMMS
jgi:hypothetical protein